MIFESLYSIVVMHRRELKNELEIGMDWPDILVRTYVAQTSPTQKQTQSKEGLFLLGYIY